MEIRITARAHITILITMPMTATMPITMQITTQRTILAIIDCQIMIISASEDTTSRIHFMLIPSGEDHDVPNVFEIVYACSKSFTLLSQLFQ